MGVQVETAAARRRRRNKAIIIGLATVVVLAVLIVVASALAPQEGASPRSGLTQAQQSELLYQQALAALRSGDDTGAADFAKQAVAVDSTNAKAKTLLVKIDSDRATARKAGGSKGATSSTQSTVPPGVDRVFDSKVADIAALLPTAFSGFDVGGVIAGKSDADVSGNPARPGPVFRIAWAVHDRGSNAAATAFISKSSKVLYPTSPAAVTVDGFPAYFGTDGTQLATVAYARGRYVFETVVTADNVAPETLKDTAIKAAEAFADAPR